MTWSIEHTRKGPIAVLVCDECGASAKPAKADIDTADHLRREGFALSADGFEDLCFACRQLELFTS